MSRVGFAGEDFFEKFWLSTDRSAVFKLFSTEHLIGLAIIFSIIILLVLFNDFFTKHRKGIANFLAFIMFSHSFLVQFWYYERGQYTLKESLPLYLCRIAMILCVVMLIAKKYKVFEVVYFWTMSGALIGLFNCDIGGYAFPHWMYFQFFIGHGGMLISTVFMMTAFKYKPCGSSLKKTYIYSFVYLVFTVIINILVKGNYSYLMAKPQGKTILDIFPKYPYYIPLMLLAMFVIYYLLYFPFKVLELRKPKPLRFESRTLFRD
ncbi:TIGR02206 family membrane protein [Clostridium sp. 'deep sea']|uniref:YwaF family protein n=1 Tax=Clostridium sp. 'deep sea' TaxID=2779445 RepID=UPI0018965AA9|nr:TIGR02206 family membrane protein [Clostridium sp. 'deep sea']QOR36146.1 TIGR02206 family membrane protein [Clostridium sp. 'deep sea']